MSKNFFSSLVTATALLGALSWGISLSAQDATTPQSQQPQSQPSQAPDASGQATPGQASPQSPEQGAPAQSAPPAQAPDAHAQSASGVQTFTGTVVKSGDKYMLQDDASGTTYDLDHQDQVAKFEGKKVRVHGTVDPSGKMIHVQ